MKTLQDILRDIEKLPPSIEIVVIDLFCGAGGFSWGVEKAKINGKKVAKVLICVNHDALAIESHYENMPDALHFIEDIRTVGLAPMVKIVNKVRQLFPHIKIMLHASLECTNHSKAKGGMSRDADSRTLAHHLFRYVEAIQPDYISIENVEEFLIWGPLQEKVIKDKKGNELYCPLDIKRDKKTKTIDVRPVWIPIPERKAEFYNKWVDDMKVLGYKYDYRLLNAADYGARTSRKRFFGYFARPNLPIVWPEPTHAKDPQNDLFSSRKKWNPVKDVLDLQLEGDSIFRRKTPLVDPTIDRITAGCIQFVGGGKDKFLVKYNSMSQRKTYVAPSIDAPSPVISTQGRLAIAFISKYFSGHPESMNTGIDQPCETLTVKDRMAKVHCSFLSAYYGSGNNIHSISGPAPTVTTKDRISLVSPFFMNYYSGGGQLAATDQPCPALTTTPKQRIVTCQFIYQQFWNSNPVSFEQPLGAITTNPKYNLISCAPWIMNTNFGNVGASINEPAQTITANRKWHYLMNPISVNDNMAPFIRKIPGGLAYEIYKTDSPSMVKLKEVMALYGITDIKMRMLIIPELKRIMGLPANYVLKGSKTKQKKFIGNMVEVTQATANITAICSRLSQLRIAA